jgi:hypothetical protein
MKATNLLLDSQTTITSALKDTRIMSSAVKLQISGSQTGQWDYLRGCEKARGQQGGAEGVLQNAKMCNNYLLFDYELKPKFKKSYQEF